MDYLFKIKKNFFNFAIEPYGFLHILDISSISDILFASSSPTL